MNCLSKKEQERFISAVLSSKSLEMLLFMRDTVLSHAKPLTCCLWGVVKKGEKADVRLLGVRSNEGMMMVVAAVTALAVPFARIPASHSQHTHTHKTGPCLSQKRRCPS